MRNKKWPVFELSWDGVPISWFFPEDKSSNVGIQWNQGWLSRKGVTVPQYLLNCLYSLVPPLSNHQGSIIFKTANKKKKKNNHVVVSLVAGYVYTALRLIIQSRCKNLCAAMPTISLPISELPVQNISELLICIQFTSSPFRTNLFLWDGSIPFLEAYSSFVQLHDIHAAC